MCVDDVFVELAHYSPINSPHCIFYLFYSFYLFVTIIRYKIINNNNTNDSIIVKGRVGELGELFVYFIKNKK